MLMVALMLAAMIVSGYVLFRLARGMRASTTADGFLVGINEPRMVSFQGNPVQCVLVVVTWAVALAFFAYVFLSAAGRLLVAMRT